MWEQIFATAALIVAAIAVVVVLVILFMGLGRGFFNDFFGN